MRIALALIMVAGLAATANADVYTWFTTTSDATEAAALQGTVLDLGPGTGSETFHVYQWVGVESFTLNGYNCDLAYSDDSGVFEISNLAVTTPAMWFPAAGTSDADGWWAYGGADIMGMAPMADGVYQLADFDLTVDYSAATGTESVLGGVGMNEWASPTGDLFGIQFGAGDAISCVDTDTFTPVIAIPEPSTLALLGFGALALIRRR